MAKFDIGQGIQIIANVGVIAGIVFLGIELSQNNSLMEYQRRLSSLELRQTSADLLIQNVELRNALVKDLSGENLSQDESLLLTLMRGKVISTMEWQFLELPETHDQLRRSVVESRGMFTGEGWGSIRGSLDSEFVRFVEETIERGTD